MALISVSSMSGFYFLRAAIQDAMISVDAELNGAVAEITQTVADRLRDESPINRNGPGSGPNPPGDSDGPLAYSYVPEVTHYLPGRAGGRVSTTQPTKLKFVRYGTGIYGPRGQRIYPRRAKALRWVDLSGVRFAKSVAGQQPFDFVTPVVKTGLAEGKELCMASVGAALVETLILR